MIGVELMNSDGIYNNADFRNKEIMVERSEYEFPDEVGLYTITGKTICRYWGKKGNLILLVETNDGRKLKFSFWSNTKYCCEPIPSRKIVVERESVRYLKDGSKVILTCEKGEKASFTRIRQIEKMT